MTTKRLTRRSPVFWLAVALLWTAGAAAQGAIWRWDTGLTLLGVAVQTVALLAVALLDVLARRN